MFLLSKYSLRCALELHSVGSWAIHDGLRQAEGALLEEMCMGSIGLQDYLESSKSDVPVCGYNGGHCHVLLYTALFSEI